MHPAATIAFFPGECGPDSVSNAGGADPWFGSLEGLFELVELEILQPKPSAVSAKNANTTTARFIMNTTSRK